MSEGTILIGGGLTGQVHMLPRMANRHGLIAGATGTGKTVTLQCLAEQFSRLGVPVVVADVKGDLSGVSQPGAAHPKIDERLRAIGIADFAFAGSPVTFWDVYGQSGHPLRVSVSDMGPMLLGRLLNLNETQSGVLNAAFHLADDEGLLLLDLKDLRAIIQFVGENGASLRSRYGNIAAASVGAIQRRLLELEAQGADQLFGEPAVSLDDLMQTAADGRGMINIIASEKLYQAPLMYSTVLLWLLSELFEQLPEVGDRDKPRLVFFFDEAHLLFDGAPAALVEKIEQVVRLIRSKGVGVYFITQSPADVPDAVLGQLGNRIQHALRAFTPRDQKAVRVAAQTFRPNPAVDTEATITSLGVGEALVSVLAADGSPTLVDKVLVGPPRSRIGPVTEDERQSIIRGSAVYGAFERVLDRESAYEILQARAAQAAKAATEADAREAEARASRSSTRRGDSLVESVLKSTLRSLGSQLGRSLGQQLLRGVLGSLGGRR